MNLKTLRPTELDRLIEANKPIFVLNTSSMPPDGDKGTIVVNFYNGNRRDYFKMPPTFIPMAISDAIPPEMLKNSRDFRQILLKEMLTLVEPNSAEQYLLSVEAREEHNALVLSEHSMKAQNIDIQGQVAKRTKVAHSNYQGHGPSHDTTTVDSVSNKVRGIVESVVSNETTPKDALQQLRRQQSSLAEIDFSYVIANAPDAAMQQWARGALSALTGEQTTSKPAVTQTIQKAAKKAPQVKAKTKKEEAAFDFGDGETLSSTDLRTDAEALARARETQAVGGQSRYNEEINKILSGV